MPGAGRRGTGYFMGTACQLGKMRILGTDGGCGCTAVRMYSTPLNCALTNGEGGQHIEVSCDALISIANFPFESLSSPVWSSLQLYTGVKFWQMDVTRKTTRVVVVWDLRGDRARRQEGRRTAKHSSVDLEILIWSKRNITAITSANELKRQKLGLKESIFVSMTQEAVSLRQKSACEKGT